MSRQLNSLTQNPKHENITVGATDLTIYDTNGVM